MRVIISLTLLFLYALLSFQATSYGSSSSKPLTIEGLKNAEYQSEFAVNGRVKLTRGIYKGKIVPNSAKSKMRDLGGPKSLAKTLWKKSLRTRSNSPPEIERRNMRQFVYRSLAVFILAHLFLNLSAFSNGYCEEGTIRPRHEYGLSLLAGAGQEDGLDIRYYAVYPRWGWTFLERHAFELEGNIGHYRLDSIDMTSLGLQGLFTYEFYRFKRGKAFIAAGGGLI